MKRENIKYVEVLTYPGIWEKRILLQKIAGGKCLCVAEGYEETYIDSDTSTFVVDSCRASEWREIKELEYVPYESIEDFKDRLAGGLVLVKKGFYPQRIVSTGSNCVWVAKRDETEEIYFDSLFEFYIWYSDGAPCGKIKEG